MIDAAGFRAGVGIIIINASRRVFWARRVNQRAWQFPQGGIKEGETPLDAMYRELKEEVGLEPEAVEVLDEVPGWLRYRLPKKHIRYHTKPLCIGQKQKWFLLKFIGEESEFRFDQSDTPEFDSWRWANYWLPVRQVVAFKRHIYRQALRHFASQIFPQHRPKR